VKCDDVRAMVVDGLVTREALSDTALLAHLDSCAACRAVRDDYETIWRDLGGLTTVGPSPDARARFALRFAAARLSAPSGAPRSILPWGVGVAAAALIAGLAGYGVGARHLLERTGPVPSQAAVAEPRFLLLLHEDSTFRHGEAPVPRKTLEAEYNRWADGLDAGTLVTDAALPDSGIWLGAPHAPTALGDRVDGFFEIRAKNRAEAEHVAATCPHLRHGGRIEVRLIDRT
jgi:hypothetical protein